MTNNYASYNGWVLPGSGSTPGCGDGYVDCNGDLWVPCFCCSGAAGPSGASGSTGTGALPAAASAAAPTAEELARLSDKLLDAVARLEALRNKERRPHI